jgi:hypothetical protein
VLGYGNPSPERLRLTKGEVRSYIDPLLGLRCYRDRKGILCYTISPDHRGRTQAAVKKDRTMGSRPHVTACSADLGREGRDDTDS